MAKQKVCVRCGESMEDGEDRKCALGLHCVCIPCKRGEYPCNQTGTWRGFAIVSKGTERFVGGDRLLGFPILSNSHADLKARVGQSGGVVEIEIRIVKK